MPVSTDYIKLGDLVFFEEDDKCLGVSGIGTADSVDTCHAHEPASLHISGEFSTKCVFTVHSQGTWTHLQNFKMALERQGMSMTEGMNSQETCGAYRECQRELERNEKDAARQVGRDLRFGMVVELRHYSSSKHLATSRQPATGCVGNRAIVDEHAGEGGWFRVMPRLRVHNEGEKVHSGDPIVFEEVGTGQRLLFSGALPDGTVEVISATSATLATAPADTTGSTSFKMRLFRSSADEGTRNLLLAGSACTLFHTETESFLGSRAARSAHVDMIAGAASSSSIWQILNEEGENGAACRWEGRFRIRHVATGHFLSVQPAGRAGGSKTLVVRLVDGGQADEGEMLFNFEPQYEMSGHITTLHFLRLVHETADGETIYLHAKPTATSVAAAEGAAVGGAPDAGAGVPAPSAAPGEADDAIGASEAAHIPLLLSTDPEDADVFAVRPVEHSRFADLLYVINSISPFTAFLESQNHLLPQEGGGANAAKSMAPTASSTTAPTAAPPLGGIPDGKSHPMPMRTITNTLVELIKFVTKSDNLDPFTREGMPIEQRQLILAEQGVLQLAIECVDAPFRARMYTHEEVAAIEKLSSALLEHQKLGRLAMRLVRHILRGQSTNKLHALSQVPNLLTLLPVGWGASECLTTLFTDNDMVDRVPDETIRMFVELIRTKGRLDRYVQFLEVLCACRGKAVRANQWRIARMLLEDAPELLLSLRLDGGAEQRILIAGDPQYFPKLAEHGGQMELRTWLDSTERGTAAYFEALTSLYAALVRGRNLKVTPVLQRLLPYNLVCRVICDEALHTQHLDCSRQFVCIARDLWVNNDIYSPAGSIREAHPTMVYVKTVRVWTRVPEIARKGVLSSRYNLSIDASPDWTQFNELKTFAISFISRHPSQKATMIQTNFMILELVKLMHALVLTGFFRSSELVDVIGPLLSLLDGRHDTTGRASDGPTARYDRETTVTVNTVVIMECKEWLCNIFQLICTVRLDIRLSLVLGLYHTKREGKGRGNANISYGSRDPQAAQLKRQQTVSFKDAKKKTIALTKHSSSGNEVDFEPLFSVLQMGKLTSKREGDEGVRKTMGGKMRRTSIVKVTPYAASTDEALEEDAGGRNADLVGILIDLTYYKSPELVSAALGLLVRNFEQRKVLEGAARKVQLLVKPTMCKMYATFDALLSQVTLLAERRRLYDDEPYRAVVLMGQLTALCFEFPDEDDDAPQESSGGSNTVQMLKIGDTSESFTEKAPSIGRESRAKSRAAKSAKKSSSDHTTGMFLLCVGKATATLDSKTLNVVRLEAEAPPMYRGCRVQIHGQMHDIESADEKQIVLEEALKLGSGGVASGGFARGEPEVVWLFLEQQAGGEPNPDMQLLLFNMNAHLAAQKLLRLPIASEVRSQEMPQREVILGAYRLLKALSSGFKVTQMALLPEIPHIVAHTNYNLVSYDITPTDGLIAVLKDNPLGCLQVGDDLIRNFVARAAASKAPRFLRFLYNITGSESAPIIRTQTLVMQALSDNPASQLTFRGDAGKAERMSLIESDDLKKNPRGKLAYHIEFVGLVARCTEGIAPQPESIARGIFSMSDLLENLLLPELPLALKTAYIKVLDEAYLYVKRSVNDVASSPEMARLIEALATQLHEYREATLPLLDVDFDENRDELELTRYVLIQVMNTMSLFYERHFLPGRVSEEIQAASKSFGEVLIMLKEAIEDDQCIVAHKLPLLLVVRCLKALASREIIEVEETTTLGHSMKRNHTLRTAGRVVMAQVAAAKPHITKQSLVDFETRARELSSSRLSVPPVVRSTSPTRPTTSGPPKTPPPTPSKRTRLAPGTPLSLSPFHSYGSKKNLSLAANEPAELEHPQTHLRAFVDDFALKCNVSAEFSNLVDAFLVGLDDDATTPAGQEKSNPPAENLIEQLRPRAGDDLDVHQAVACARVLCACLAQSPSNAVLHKRQDVFRGFGACAVVIRLVSCEHPELYKAGLELGKQMVRNGNARVQQKFYDLMNSADTQHVAPLDGTRGTFFTRMRDSLRLAVKEIPERITYMQSQADAALNFAEITEGLAGATVELLRADLEQEFTTRAYPELLLAFLKELCEGHFVPMQDLLHDQPNTIFDIDLVFEGYSLLLHLEQVLDTHNIGQAELACEVLIEVLQGNTSGVNSEALLDTKLIELCDRLLTTPRNRHDRTVLAKSNERKGGLSDKPGTGADDNAEAGATSDAIGAISADASAEDLMLAREDLLISKHKMLELREAVLTLLHALLESSEVATLARIEAVVDLHALANLAGQWFDEYGEVATTGRRVSDEAREEARIGMHAGFQAILLLRKVTDRKPTLAGTTYEDMSSESRAHYDKYVGRVELCKENGELDRVYFRVPQHFLLAPRTKEAVLWGVDRETPGQAVQEFLLMVLDLHVEVMWQEFVGNMMMWKMIQKYELIINNASVVLAVVQNILLFADSTVMMEYKSGTSADWKALLQVNSTLDSNATASLYELVEAKDNVIEVWDIAYYGIRIGLASVQILTCFLATVVTFVRSTFLKVLRRWLALTGLTIRETMGMFGSPISNFRSLCRFFGLMAYVIVTDGELIGRVLFTAFAIAGAAVSWGERFFVIHLMQVVIANKGLMDVLRAVTQNGKQLLLTTLLTFIIIWIFAVWGTFVEKSEFLTEDGSELSLCHSPGHCWLEIVNSLATGDIGDLLMNRPRYHVQDDWFGYLRVWIYQFLLFVFVVIILLNVVFGIIIDTFGELRGEKAAKKAHMENTCFICGVDRFTFDTKGEGFDEHIRKDHWMWTYLAMMIHICEKDPTQYNGWETYVAAKMAARDTAFMPRNTAIVLQASQAADDAAAEELKKRVGDIEANSQLMMTMLEGIQRDNAAILERLGERPGGGVGGSMKQLPLATI